MSLATSIADMNYAHNLALTTLRAKLVSEAHTINLQIANHLREYRHGMTPLEVKLWAAKDGNLRGRLDATHKVILLINESLKS